MNHHIPPVAGGYLDQPPALMADFAVLNLLDVYWHEVIRRENAPDRDKSQPPPPRPPRPQASDAKRTAQVLTFDDL